MAWDALSRVNLLSPVSQASPLECAHLEADRAWVLQGPVRGFARCSGQSSRAGVGGGGIKCSTSPCLGQQAVKTRTSQRLNCSLDPKAETRCPESADCMRSGLIFYGSDWTVHGVLSSFRAFQCKHFPVPAHHAQADCWSLRCCFSLSHVPSAPKSIVQKAQGFHENALELTAALLTVQAPSGTAKGRQTPGGERRVVVPGRPLGTTPTPV